MNSVPLRNIASCMRVDLDALNRDIQKYEIKENIKVKVTFYFAKNYLL